MICALAQISTHNQKMKNYQKCRPDKSGPKLAMVGAHLLSSTMQMTPAHNVRNNTIRGADYPLLLRRGAKESG
jgi:hypothetical protein